MVLNWIAYELRFSTTILFRMARITAKRIFKVQFDMGVRSDTSHVGVVHQPRQVPFLFLGLWYIYAASGFVSSTLTPCFSPTVVHVFSLPVRTFLRISVTKASPTTSVKGQGSSSSSLVVMVRNFWFILVPQVYYRASEGRVDVSKGFHSAQHSDSTKLRVH